MRLRFAPSPTGPLHMGGVRTALYNYLLCKKHHGKFILRIEDTDQARFVEGAESHIIKSLSWCGILPDESPENPGAFGPYRQSERSEIYQKEIAGLIEKGLAYYAFDTSEELDQMRTRLESEKSASRQYDAITRMTMRNSLTLDDATVKELLEKKTPHVIRIKLPGEGKLIFSDLVRGTIEVDLASLDDKVLFKSDGLPTYHFANVVDDYYMQISHVIRGEEWLPSAPLHWILYDYLGWSDKRPEFAHLPLILKPDGKGKLSKRDCDRLGLPVFAVAWKDPVTGEVSDGYAEKGYLPETFLNMLAMLGWNPGTEQEYFTLTEMIEAFSLDRVGKSGSRFDMAKVNWFQEQHFRKLPDHEILELVRPLLKDHNITAEDGFVLHVIALMKDRIAFPGDIISQGAFFFQRPASYDEITIRKKWKPESKEILEQWIAVYENLPADNPTVLEESYKKMLEAKGYAIGLGMISLRLVLTGIGGGPSLFDLMALLGREEIVHRIQTGISQIHAEV
ncbi:MAG: glutamate--tRNA ligase [Flavobacteriales bacterium]|nr:glutamate--tRNA ligase [Flavobacteriales bacterium]